MVARPLRVAPSQQVGISTFLIDRIDRTTSHLYVAFVEGSIPWNLAGPTPPRLGEVVAGSRVLAVSLLPKTITFRSEAG